MPRNLLTARQIQIAVDGDHFDGDGLVLRLRSERGSWVFRYTAPDGRRREMGLGTVTRNNIAEAGKSLTIARDLAESARKELREGRDPIAVRDRRRDEAKRERESARSASQAQARTLARVAREYHERVVEPHRSVKHSADWINSLEQHVPSQIWHAPVDQVNAPQLLDFFAAVRRSHRETGRRIVQRLIRVFSDAEFRGWCRGNPAAAAAGRLRELGIRREVVSYSALPYADAPRFMRDLRQRQGIAARALEFAVLTAARTGEVIGSTPAEFDLDRCLWTIPGNRMKGGQTHVVYLSERAVEIARETLSLRQPFAFPSPALNGQPLSNMAMLTLLRRMSLDKQTTVHGLCRSTFSTWANETAAARPDVIEACLAHQEANRVRAAYNRAQFADERRALLMRWSEFLDGKAVTPIVLPLLRAAA